MSLIRRGITHDDPVEGATLAGFLAQIPTMVFRLPSTLRWMHLFFRVVIPIRACQVVGGGILLERYITTVSSRGWQGATLSGWSNQFRREHFESLGQTRRRRRKRAGYAYFCSRGFVALSSIIPVERQISVFFSLTSSTNWRKLSIDFKELPSGP